jgi:cytochrome c oxidase cbb3-type subunit 3
MDRTTWLMPAMAGLLAALLIGAADAAPRDEAVLREPDVDLIAADAALAAHAAAVAQPLYARHCAACHGGQRKGDQARGVPNLADGHWQWNDATADSELQALVQTLRYGIRSGHAKTRNYGDMPAYAGGAAKLSDAQVDDLTDYVLSLSGRPHDAPAAARGKALYNGAPNCFDCHGADGSGNPDWGASDLGAKADSAWLYGAQREAVRRSIALGRHGSCPDWEGRLNDSQLKALAVWLHAPAAAH